jgi:hypothetical protein
VNRSIIHFVWPRFHQLASPRSLGGVEFAEELVNAMDFYRAGRRDPSLKAFISELTSQLKLLQG